MRGVEFLKNHNSEETDGNSPVSYLDLSSFVPEMEHAGSDLAMSLSTRLVSQCPRLSPSTTFKSPSVDQRATPSLVSSGVKRKTKKPGRSRQTRWQKSDGVGKVRKCQPLFCEMKLRRPSVFTSIAVSSRPFVKSVSQMQGNRHSTPNCRALCVASLNHARRRVFQKGRDIARTPVRNIQTVTIARGELHWPFPLLMAKKFR